MSSKLLNFDPFAAAFEKREKTDEPQGEDGRPIVSSQPTQSSQPNLSNQPVPSSQPVLSSQPVEPPRAGPVSNQPARSSQPAGSSRPAAGRQGSNATINLIAALPEVKGHGELPYQILDHLLRQLSPDEQAIYIQLYRLSWGWGKEICEISNPKLSERSNVPLSTMKRKVGLLVSKGLVEKINTVIGYGKDQAVVYRVAAPSWQLARSRQPIQSRQPTAGRNKEELNQNTKGDFTSCPDCFGTEWYYPHGTTNGVVRCQHARLK